MDKIRTSCSNLPTGWVKEVVIRKSGASAGKSDVYYYSPEGKKCRSKPQMLQYLPDDFDIENFDFRAGNDISLKKRKKRKDDFDFGKDFNLPNSKPNRQTKKAWDNIEVTVLSGKHSKENKDEVYYPHAKKPLSRSMLAENEAKKKRADILSQQFAKPRQLFWHLRLQNLFPINEKTMELCKQAELNNFVKEILPGSNNQSLLNSLAYNFLNCNKIVGQQASLSALRKHPTALCNADQPFTTPISISDDMIQLQRKRVESARKKLAEAQDLLRALEEEDEDIDDMEE
ncbi:methyl-CpG-binding domain protein 2 isoform X2 [Hydra vulgaris]|uniref:Methyl-CpG-binding domain protein 2 isoform X2 n=1 Tax=Hydra vulgaris TaxID=6087 RepID=A0ABM4DD62_HYDVU